MQYVSGGKNVSAHGEKDTLLFAVRLVFYFDIMKWKKICKLMQFRAFILIDFKDHLDKAIKANYPPTHSHVILLQKVSPTRLAMDHFARKIGLVLRLCRVQKKLVRKIQNQRE